MRIIVTATLTAMLGAPIASADDPCHPQAELLENPYIARIDRCVFSLFTGEQTAERRDFALRLVLRALSDESYGNLGPGIPLSYQRLAELVARLNDQGAVDAFLDFIARYPSSPDEERSFGVARLYELRTPLVLERLATKSADDQNVILSSLAWGVVNNFYPFIDGRNYRRLPVGGHWEVISDNYPHRALSRRLEERVLEVLEATEGEAAELKLACAEEARGTGMKECE